MTDEPALLRVRDGTVADCDEVAAAVGNLELLTRYGATVEGLARDLRGAVERGEGLLVVEEAIPNRPGGARPVGFAWFLASGGFARGGYLRLIAVVPGRARRGAGSALLRELEQRVAATTRWLFLLVSDFNVQAQRF